MCSLIKLKMKNLVIVVLAFLLISCGSDSFSTESGIEVKYEEKGTGELPVDSLIGLFYIECKTPDGKVILKVDPNNPQPLKVDPASQAQQGELYEILAKLRTGDSVGFELLAEDLFTKTFQRPLPDSIDAGSKLKFQIAFIDQLTEEGYYEMMAKKAEELGAKQLAIDTDILNEYLTKNNIVTEKTESGLQYVITEQGSGPLPEDGQRVQVAYAGWVLDGPYFDTSIESVAREQGLYNERRTYQPYEFPLGRGQVIRGWDLGVALLNVGSKATLYIPSTLGYQTRGSGSIPPNAILVFDVELVGIQ